MSNRLHIVPGKKPRRRLGPSTHVMRFTINQALLSPAAETDAERSMRAAMKAFSPFLEFDTWLVGSVGLDSQAIPTFEHLQSGGLHPNVVDGVQRRWIEHVRHDAPSMQPIVSMVKYRIPQRQPLIRVWQDPAERALLSIWLHSITSSTATWISVHRVGPQPERFLLRDRRALCALHENCAEILRLEMSRKTLDESQTLEAGPSSGRFHVQLQYSSSTQQTQPARGRAGSPSADNRVDTMG